MFVIREKIYAHSVFRTHAARVFIIYLQTTRQVPGSTASLFKDIKPNAQ